MLKQRFPAYHPMKNLSSYIQKYPHRTQSLLGLNFEQLNQLLAELKRNERSIVSMLEG